MKNIKEDIETKVKYMKYSDRYRYSRYFSLEHCFVFFQNNFVNKDSLSNEEYDLAALNLATYLSSWGMYRGSSLILGLNYKVYIELLKKLHAKAYKFNPYDILNCDDRKVCECYNTIEQYFNNIAKEYHECCNDFRIRKVTSTFITKLLMGIYGVTPAFDRFFVIGLGDYNKEYKEVKIVPSWFSARNKIKDCFAQMLNFYKQYQTTIDALTEKFYEEDKSHKIPPMRIIDMYFWVTGNKELGLHKEEK